MPFRNASSSNGRKLFFLDRQKPGRVGLVGVRLKQRRATRTERTVSVKFDRANVKR